MKSLGCFTLFTIAAACTLLAVVVSVIAGFFRIGYNFITGGAVKNNTGNAAKSHRGDGFSHSGHAGRPRKKAEPAPRNGKIFDKSEGEYVDFEEV